uniref:UDENN FNIP1/2-type domain-containing protein n=1 Tax=Anopheles braziliensis TaxID=58242 RepID=A0A2M3Z1K8_9DIPT
MVSGGGGGAGGGGHGGPVDYNPSVSDLSSIGTGSLHSFTVSSSTATQHDPSLQHRLRPVLPAEFCNFDRFADLRHSSNSGVDSGYGGTDPWFHHSSSSSSYRHPASSSHRSSISSLYSDFDYMRRMSVDNFSMDIPPSPNCVSLGDCQSYGSFHRRVSKNLSTSFENRLTIADHVGHLEELGPMLAAAASTATATANATASDGCVVTRNRRNSETFELGRRKAYSGGELLSTATNYQAKAPSKKQRLGLAVCIKLNEVMLQDTDTFCSEHMTVFESILCRVRIAVEKAYVRWKLFLQIMLGAWHSTQQWLGDLFTAPRLSNPVWLTLSSSTLTDRNLATVANTFMSDLCSLLSSADTKDTNFFISTLITAVLTHHLGWVGTIAAMTASDDSSPSSKLDLIRREKIRMTEITANHPYSVLWAQLGDLYGAVGYPTKLSKTIVCSSGQLGNMLDKILNVLSYFIRCSEIKRTVYVESFDESNVRTAFIAQRTLPVTHDDATASERSKSLNTLTVVPSSGSGNMVGNPSPKLLRRASSSSGLVRSATRMKNLATLGEGMGGETSTDTALEGGNENSRTVSASGGAVGGEGEEVQKALKKNIMNDIPNVLVYRDSRFVRQELRIGNKSMDTGLVMNDREKQYLEAHYQIGKAGPLQAAQVAALLQQQRQTPPDELAEDALILEQQQQQQQQQHDADDDDGFDRESVRLSYLITENSIGQSGQPADHGEQQQQQQRLIWGVDKSKEGIAFEQLKYIHLLRGDFNLWKDSSTDSGVVAHGEPKDQESEADEVVFVLGDNDRLKNIHRKGGEKDSVKPLGPLMKHCCHQKYNRFNKYRQIAANFLKSRNLPDCHLLERSSKSTVVEGGDGELPKTPVGESDTVKLDHPGDQCSTCRQIPSMFYLQTPTNASEMEFVREATSYRYLDEQSEPLEANERLHPDDLQPYADAYSTLHTGNHGWPGHEYNIPQIILSPHMATLDENDELKAKHPHSILKLIDIPFPKGMRTATGGHNDENNNPHGGGGGGGSGTGGVSSGCNGSLSSSHAGHMGETAGTGRESDKTDRGGQGGLLRCYHRTGFMPSLFSRITDHYMPDMVLQATTAKPSEWETTLKRDLNVAAHFTLFEQHLTENNAIVANLDKHEVRLHSSQSLVDGDIVGMSQLVSSMLEAVNAMWSAGISAYQCMAFIESKLREMYLQSETIASVMLATDFCTTGSITSAMDITANDMDLLMSVASVHTPEVTKRYRVLMR